MKPSPDALDHAVLQQAANWYARLQAGTVDPATRAAWEHWHAQQDAHRLAWQYVERIGQRFERLQADGDMAMDTLNNARRLHQSRRQALRTLAVLSGGALLGWVGWKPAQQGLMAWRADYRSATGEIREIALADGSQVWLNSASALDVDYRPALRQLRLLRGEVLIDTAKDARPFVVETAQGSLRALGTRFSVLQQDDHSLLSVFEGAVEVRSADSGARRIVHAGQQLRFDRGSLADTEPVAQGRQSWSRGVLLAEDLPLAQFIAELARYRHGHLGVAPEVAHLRVMGAYPLHDSEQTLAMLESALPIRIQRTLPWWISIEPR
ncbi:Protein FecR [compost metagenome]